jgi:hypothetical protein
MITSIILDIPGSNSHPLTQTSRPVQGPEHQNSAIGLLHAEQIE